MPKRSRENILKNLGKTPVCIDAFSLERRCETDQPRKQVTNYQPDGSAEDTGFFGLRPGDPRSDLVLSVAKNGTALPLLLNRLDGPDAFEPPSSERVGAISPQAQARRGNYAAPTYIIHSRSDLIAPFSAAERFIAELKSQGVDCGLLELESAPHLHDLYLRPGTREWEEQVGPGYRFLQAVI